MQAFADQWGYWTGYASSGFNNAKRGMIMNGNWMPGAMRNVVDVTGVELDTIGYGFHPNLNEGLKAIDFGTGHTLFMPRGTEVAEDALEFMIHMTSVEVGLIEFEIRAAAMWSKPLLDAIDLSSVPGLQWFFDAPIHADRLWSPSEFLTPVQSQVENLWQRAIEETIVGAKSAEDSLVDINSELQQSLGRVLGDPSLVSPLCETNRSRPWLCIQGVTTFLGPSRQERPGSSLNRRRRYDPHRTDRRTARSRSRRERRVHQPAGPTPTLSQASDQAQ